MYIVRPFNKFCSYWYKTVWVRESLMYLHIPCRYSRLLYGTSTARYHTVENFWGRQLWRISRFGGYSQKFSQRNLRACVTSVGGTSKHPEKFSPWNLYFSLICKSFPSWEFSAIQYIVQISCHLACCCWYIFQCLCMCELTSHFFSHQYSLPAGAEWPGVKQRLQMSCHDMLTHHEHSAST